MLTATIIFLLFLILVYFGYQKLPWEVLCNPLSQNRKLRYHYVWRTGVYPDKPFEFSRSHRFLRAALFWERRSSVGEGRLIDTRTGEVILEHNELTRLMEVENDPLKDMYNR